MKNVREKNLEALASLEMKMNHPSRHALTCLSILALIASFLHTEDAEARRQNRSPRYQRSVNSAQCETYSWRPKAKPVPGGRAANDRVPYMTARVHAYLEAPVQDHIIETVRDALKS